MKELCSAAGAALALVLAGCASYSGSGLQAGKATAADVEASMGKPDGRLAKPDGSSVLYFSRGPAGRQNFAATLGPDGRLKSIEPLLTGENVAKLVPGRLTKKDVLALIGPSVVISRLTRQQRDVWEYRRMERDEARILWVQFSDDGVLREVLDMHDAVVDGFNM
ncbi:MAG: hypothetical protein HY017_33105 [Betaproteobacteria bacterium]|nr:hypothetical protein [Betaproteobacteria bacterium]